MYNVQCKMYKVIAQNDFQKCKISKYIVMYVQCTM